MFHTRDYLDFLARADEEDERDIEKQEEHGLGYDCPVLPDMLKWVKVVGGASLTAADHLLKGANVSINWKRSSSNQMFEIVHLGLMIAQLPAAMAGNIGARESWSG